MGQLWVDLDVDLRVFLDRPNLAAFVRFQIQLFEVIRGLVPFKVFLVFIVTGGVVFGDRRLNDLLNILDYGC